MNCFLKKYMLLFLCVFPMVGFTQGIVPENKNSELYKNTDTTIHVIVSTAYTDGNLFNASNYFNLLSGNLKESFTKPFHATGEDWSNFGKFAILAVGVSFADKPIQKEGLEFSQKETSLNKVSTKISELAGFSGIIIGLATTGTVGLIIKNEKLVNTTLLATQALITGSAITTSIKYLAGRRRPYSYLPSEEARPTFMGPFSKDPNGNSFNNSFPSGHTTVSFAIATVFASEYRDNNLVPIIAYSLATLVGVSRISENQHWTTDVFTGAAIGYLSGKQAVKNYHQFSKRRADGKLKNSLSYTLNYSFGHWEPGMVLHLR